MSLIGRRQVFTLATAIAALAATPARAVGAEAAQPVARFTAALLAGMKAGSAESFQKRYDGLAPVVNQTFDLQAILQSCVGPRWASLSDSERDALSKVFARFTIASWVANFNRFNGERFEVEPDARAVGDEEVVATKLVPADGNDPQRIDYVMRRTDAGWRAVDVLLDGSISRVAVQRSDFRALLADGVPALIASLQQKAAELAGGEATP